MRKFNKAHTATIHRIARRYGATIPPNNPCELQTPHGFVGVETAATIGRRVRALRQHHGPAYVAVTNKEALSDALRATQRSRIGVMDPQGNIVKMAESDGQTTKTAKNSSVKAGVNGRSVARA